MWNLYEKLSQMAVSSHGVSLLPKLKLEHVKLTSFSKMRVDLAAQVILYMYCMCIDVLLSLCFFDFRTETNYHFRVLM